MRTDKTGKTNNKRIKEAQETRKKLRKTFQEACRTDTEEEKISTKKEYFESQIKLRTKIEEAVAMNIENKLKEIHRKAKINPNIIWDARKRVKASNGLDYPTYTEEGEQITNPNKTKEHIANYFEDLYQAREGKVECKEWTEKITAHVKKTLEEAETRATSAEDKINTKEMNHTIKRLQRNKSTGPDDIPNELFIEANEETKEILKAMIENVHKSEEIPPAWEEGEIIRLYKGKSQKGKCSNERGITLASNVGKVYERIINERVKKQITITKAQAGGKPGCATTDH